ncbi:MAG: RNA-binding ATPase activator esf2 [Watsoniomyces obsoletus]|nr:MAG: RNA-binding ATPase activator esf2 [Watsoniomyces obsoletus]
MVRTLPWVTGPSRQESRKPETPKKRTKAALPTSDLETSPKESPRSKRTAQLRQRFDQDDVYIMVEDELLSIAKAFTQHLHHAEYVRMKEAAKRRNKATSGVEGVLRPVDTRTVMSEPLKKRKIAEEKRKAQQKALNMVMNGNSGTSKEAEKRGEEEEEEDPWMGTTLQDLMSRGDGGGGRKESSLSKFAGYKSGSRATGAFARSSHREQNTNSRLGQGMGITSVGDDDTTASETDEDLDMPMNVPAIRTARGVSHAIQKPDTTQKTGDRESRQKVTHRTTTKVLEPEPDKGIEQKSGSTFSSESPARAEQKRMIEQEGPSAMTAFEDGIYEPSTLRSTRGRRGAMRRTAHEDDQAKIKQEGDAQLKPARLSEIPIFLV